jgi:hypothetical protein
VLIKEEKAQGDLGGFISLVPLFNFVNALKLDKNQALKQKKGAFSIFFLKVNFFVPPKSPWAEEN